MNKTSLMSKVVKVIFLCFILSMMSCSDGTHVSQQINLLIKENNIRTLVIEKQKNGGQAIKNEYSVDQLVINGQFVAIEDEYINLGRVKSLKVNAEKLEVAIDW